MTHATHPTLAQTLAPQRTLTRDVALVLGGALLIALLAQVEIPLKPVPVTLQTLGVLLVGAALGWRRGAATLGTYIAAGTLGLPVFAGGAAGLAKLAGPTGGYLIGFLLAATLVGWLMERLALDRRVVGTAAAMLLGTAVIYAVGLPWLSVTTGLHGRALLTAGLLPFLPGDALKLGLAALLLPGAWQLTRRR
ncbi:biotin transport system substrate-specific component [Deinococcus metalli]|uniref:Biotin transporter n=1 Tax=Deinococcus metalli TaxID=1141878 RepID=A0A7W8NRF3_9DEIO|nr:biotin transporter BioY [Deinococcus metalli]MBB5376087.1 biotin transport system substrate-specific component [Deinococcus metalli]GHF40899.1 biotin biosynthesis protein BioY [Deinococcus metalli]